MKQRVILLVVLLVHLIAKAQDPVYNILNKSNGLPSNTVYNILQDNHGFIWVGHDKGISRYDGKQFKNYATASQQSKSLSNLLEFNNVIYCQDFSGNFYYVKNDSLYKQHYLNNNGLYIPAGKYNDSVMAVLNLNQLIYFNTNTQAKEIVSVNNNRFFAVDYSPKQVAFLSGNTITSIQNKNFNSSIHLLDSSKRFLHLLYLNNQYYGFRKDNHPYLYSLSNKQIQPFHILPPNLFVQSISVLENEIWVCTTTGAFCFTRSWQPKYDGQHFFKDMSISKVMVDREGNYWFTTLDKGIITVNNINIKIYRYNNQSITAISKTKQGVFVGTSAKTVLKFNEQTKQFNVFYQGNSNHEILHIYNDTIGKQFIFCSNQIDIVNYTNTRTKNIKLAGKNVQQISKNFFVVSHPQGVSLVNENKQLKALPNWINFGKWDKFYYNLNSTKVRARWVIYNSIDTVLYAATTSGLFYFSSKQKGKILFNDKEIYASQLELANNGIYAATFSDGLFFIDKNFKATNINHPKITASIFKLKKYKQHLWLLTEDALQKYDIDKNLLVNYTHADGLPKAEFKDFLIQNNQIFIATTEGLVLFYDSLNNSSIPPSLVLNKFVVNNKIFNASKNIALEHTQNNIEIDFSFLSFKGRNEKETIEYSINNSNWIALNATTRNLSLPALSPGDYSIAIRAFNEKGIQAANTLQINFTILQPFYKQGWFILVVILFTATIIYLLFRYRLQFLKQKNELLSQKIILEQQLQQSLLSSIKSQMNPHFLFNALNTIQSYIYTNDKENASTYLGKFSSLTRMILEMSNSDIVSLADEIKALKLYVELEQLRFEDKLTYHFHVDETVSTETT